MLTLSDLRHSARGLLRTPGFTLAAVATLAVGIGATAMVYSFVTAVFAASDPPQDLDRSVALWSSASSQPDQKGVVAPREFVEWRRRARAFDRVGAFRRAGFNVGGDQPVRVSGVQAAGDYVDVVDEHVMAGRGLGPLDERPGAPAVALLGERFWRDRFGGSMDALGRTIKIDGRPTSIVGILAAKPLSADLVVPLAIDPADGDFGARSLFVFARLRAGVSLEQARAEMQAVARDIEREGPAEDRGWTVNTRPLSEEYIGRNARIVFSILLAAVTAVLLIACANIAGLMAARGLAGQRARAIRSALGASRGRLAAQALVESSLVAAAGGVAGAALAYAGLAVLKASAPSMSEVVAAVRIGPRVLLFAAGASTLAAVASGLLPALEAGRVSIERVLREGSAWTPGGGRARVRAVLVAGEVALSVALLVVAGLLLRTLVALQSIEPGFEARGVLTARLTLPANEYPSPEDVATFYERTIDAARAHPSVVSASVVSRVPAAGSRYNPNRSLVVEGLIAREGEGVFAVDLAAAPGFFDTLRIPILEGRDFTARDRAGSPLVALVNRTMAARYWPGRSPLGGRLRLGDEPSPDAWRVIVGVVGDVRNDDIDAPPAPHVYVPAAQRPERSATLVVRTRGEPASFAAALRALMAGVAFDLPLYDVATMEEVVRQDLADTRVLVAVLALYALAALLLAAVGVGGLLAQTVSRRVPEIGVRLALGGSAPQVVWLLLRQALAGVGAGLVAGLALGAGLGRVIASLLYQTRPGDPLTYGAAIAALVLASLAAAAGPALRAVRVDPVITLRGEGR